MLKKSFSTLFSETISWALADYLWAYADQCGLDLGPGKLLAKGGRFYSDEYSRGYKFIEEEVCVDPALGPFKFTIRDSSG